MDLLGIKKFFLFCTIFIGLMVASTAEAVSQDISGGQWTKVKDLQVGDLLKTIDGWSAIESIEYINQPTTVYNLSVSSPNTFFANGILAHNKNCSGITYLPEISCPAANSTMDVNIHTEGATSCNGNWLNYGLLRDGISVGISGPCYADGSHCDDGFHKDDMNVGGVGSHTLQFTVNNGSCLCNTATYNVGPVPPTGLNAVCLSSTQARVSWSAVTGATGYNLRITDGIAGDTVSEVGGTPDDCFPTPAIDLCQNGWVPTSMTVNIAAGNSYNWWVHSTNGTCTSVLSSGLAFRCATPTPTYTPTPTLTPPVTPPPTVTPTPSCLKVFASSATYDGNLGGLAGADAKCQALAAAAGLTGTSVVSYVGLLSSTTTNAVDRIMDNCYQLVDGTLIANSKADLFDGAIANPINKTETGAAITGNAWSGSNASGVLKPATNPCTDWTTNSAAVNGGHGGTGRSDSFWINWGNSTCSTLLRLYCFPGFPAVTPTPVPSCNLNFEYPSWSVSPGENVNVTAAITVTNGSLSDIDPTSVNFTSDDPSIASIATKIYNPVTGTATVNIQVAGTAPAGAYYSGPPNNGIINGLASLNGGVPCTGDELILDVSSYPAWFQTAGADVHAATGIADPIPLNLVSPNFNFSLVGSGGSPGVVSYASGNASFAPGGFPSLGLPGHWLSNAQAINSSYNQLGSKIQATAACPAVAGVISSEPASGKYKCNGPLTVDTANWDVGMDSAGSFLEENIIILVEGEITIKKNIKVETNGSYLAIISNSNITIDPSVTQLEGIFLADNNFSTGSKYDPAVGTVDLVLNAAGAFIANQFNLQRKLSSSENQTKPAEVFAYRPDFWFASESFWLSPLSWQEVTP